MSMLCECESLEAPLYTEIRFPSLSLEALATAMPSLPIPRKWVYCGTTIIALKVQKCKKIRGLGCVNQACTGARVTQPSPDIFLHICRRTRLSCKQRFCFRWAKSTYFSFGKIRLPKKAQDFNNRFPSLPVQYYYST